MGPRINVLIFCLVYFSTAFSGPHARRQTFSDELMQYRTQARTAIFVIDSIRSDNASSSCANPDLIDELDATGYDGEYAQLLLCESAIGIQIFSNLEQADSDIQSALAGLDLLSDGRASNGLIEVCRNINVSTLDEAGLDGSGIREMICNASSAAETSTTLPVTSQSITATSTAQTRTTSSLPTSSSSRLDFPTQSAILSTVSTTTNASSSQSSVFPLTNMTTPVMQSTSLSTFNSDLFSSTASSNSSVPVPSSSNSPTTILVTISSSDPTPITKSSSLSERSTSITTIGVTTRTITLTTIVEATVTITASRSGLTSKPIATARRKVGQPQGKVRPQHVSKQGQSRNNPSTRSVYDCPDVEPSLTPMVTNSI